MRNDHYRFTSHGFTNWRFVRRNYEKYSTLTYLKLNADQTDPVYLILGQEDYLEQQIQRAFQNLVPKKSRK